MDGVDGEERNAGDNRRRVLPRVNEREEVGRAAARKAQRTRQHPLTNTTISSISPTHTMYNTAIKILYSVNRPHLKEVRYRRKNDEKSLKSVLI